MPYLGGHQIDSATWLDSHSIVVRFTSTYTDKLYQLYAGQTLIGTTDSYDDRIIVGSLFPSDWPQTLQMLAVDSDEVTTDFSSSLPDRPYNRAKVSATVSSWTGAKYISVYSGTTPGGSVDTAEPIYTELYDTDRTYDMVVPAVGTFEGSGAWNLEVIGRDDKEPAGNIGTAKTLTVTVLSAPPDIPAQADGSRLTVTAETGTATIDFTEVT